MVFKKEILELLSMYVTVNEDLLEIPPEGDMGDYALPCFTYAKEQKKSPNKIATELAGRILPNEIIIEAKAIGPYVNFFINKTRLANKVLKQVFKQKNEYGSSQLGVEKEALIEHTSINPNASPHLGRTRNSFIGDCLARLYRFQGFKVETHFFVNDIGKQIAMLAYACRDKQDITFNELLDIYIKVNAELESKPEFEKKIFELLNKLENGDQKIKKEFRNIVDICIKGQSTIFSEIGIEYDYFDYESKYLWNKRTEMIIEKLDKTGKVFKDEHSRNVLDLKDYELPMKTPVLVLTRKDGTSLYGLRDIAYTIDKIKRSTENNIVILGEDQKLYFMQIKAALELLGYKAPDVIHYSFVLLKEGKMSTRKGTLVLLEEVMQKAVEKAKNEIKKRREEINDEELEELARTIGYGALKFAFLKTSADKNVTFEWERALSFEGEAAPYIQYAHARINSILRKANVKITEKIDYSLYNNEETGIIKKIAFFKELVKDATLNHKPHIVAVYLHKLAQAFNEYYHKHQVICDSTPKRKARLLLVDCVAQVLKTGLGLLGIKAPEKM